jgi:hypothetical protein
MTKNNPYKPNGNATYQEFSRNLDCYVDNTINEMRFVNLKDKEDYIEDTRGLINLYYISVGQKIPSVRGYDFIKSGRRQELPNILKDNIIDGMIPREVRAIKISYDKDMWAIYVKR